MLRSTMVVLATTALALAGLSATAAPASGSTIRYASPTGSGVGCTQANPCTLAEAVSGAASGDTVQLTADEYTLNSQLDITANNLTIRGPVGVTDSASFLAYLIFPETGVANSDTKIRLFGSGTRFERLAITGRADGSAAIVADASGTNAVYDRVRISNIGSADTLLGQDATLTNSVVQQTGPGGFGSAVAITGLIDGSTIYSANGTAILQANQYHAAPSCSTIIVDTIAWGGSANMLVDDTSVGPFCGSLLTDYDRSWIPQAAGAASGGGIRVATGATAPIVGPGNLPDLPAVFDPTAPGSTYLSDLVLPVGSPAIDAGCPVGSSCSDHDYYGRPRPIGSANDIGAMEQSLPPVPGTVTVGDITRTTAAVSATLQPRGDAAEIRFQVRPVGSSIWTTVATGSQGTDLFGTPTVTGSLSGLSPGSDYQTRLLASSSRGVSASDPAPFRTLTPAPTPPPTPPPTIGVASSRGSVGKKARVTSSVTVSIAGRISQRAVSTRRPAKTRCTTSRTAAAAGQYRLVCTLSKKSRKELRRRSMRLVVTTTLTTPTGQTATATTRVTLPRKR